MKILIASAPDRDEVFAEIYEGDAQWAELSRDRDGGFRLTLWSPPSSDRECLHG